MSDDPEAAPDLHDVLDENLEASDKIQAELAVIKPNIYLPHEEYEKDVVNDEEDEAMQGMLAPIENAKN